MCYEIRKPLHTTHCKPASYNSVSFIPIRFAMCCLVPGLGMVMKLYAISPFLHPPSLPLQSLCSARLVLEILRRLMWEESSVDPLQTLQRALFCEVVSCPNCHQHGLSCLYYTCNADMVLWQSQGWEVWGGMIWYIQYTVPKYPIQFNDT